MTTKNPDQSQFSTLKKTMLFQSFFSVMGTSWLKSASGWR